MGKFEYGTGRLGRLKYRTEGEARAAGDELGLSGIHSHRMDADDDGEPEAFSMPGADHKALNSALESRGLEMTPVPGQMDGSEMGDDMMEADMGMADGMGVVGGEMTEAGAMGMDEMTVQLDGMGMGGELTEAQMPGIDGVTASMDGNGMMGGEMTGAQMDGFVGELGSQMATYDASGLDAEASDDPLISDSYGDSLDNFEVSGESDALRGVFVGDEDGDDGPEIY
jgi:hypothetical protein